MINKADVIRSSIIKATDKEIREIAFAENEDREDITPIDRAYEIVGMWQSGEYKSKIELADSLSRPQSYISKCLAVLKLDDSIIDEMMAERSNVGIEIISELSSVKNPTLQKELFEKSATRDEIREAKKNFKKPDVYTPKRFEFNESVEWKDIEDAIKKCGHKCEIIIKEIA